jgi:pimeloyl-ACP methyl ester carboxylesterase
MEKAKINGVDIAYDRQGQGSPLVLIHGFPLDHHAWDEIAPLLETDFDLIVPDLRGFGESKKVGDLESMDDFAKDIAGLLDHLEIKKAAVVGHSMGGYVALAFARLFPDRITGLGLVASQTLPDPPERKDGRYKSAAEVAEKGIGVVVDAMAPKFTSDAPLQEFARQMMERQRPEAFVASLKAMAERPDSTPLLASINYPVAVVHGDADALIPVERGREIKAALPSAYFVEIMGAGHLPMLEAREFTAEALKSLK